MKKTLSLILVLALMLSLAACGGSEPEKKSVDLNAIYEGFSDILPDMMLLDETTMMNFLGIDAADCNQVVAAICGDGLLADEVWLIEAKDEAALARLTELVNTRLTAKEEETISYTPDQYAIVEKAVIITKDLYLAFLVSPEVETMKTAVEAALN